MGGQWHLEPDTYLAMVRAEVPAYDELQAELAAATAGVPAERILDLGSGTGVTAQAVLAVHPGASLVGIDESEGMLVHARRMLPQCTFQTARLEDPLPDGPFDLVVSAFAVHHLDGAAKATLFRRVARVLAPSGRFAVCDVVVPAEPVARPVPLEDGVDVPSTVAEHLTWLADAGLEPRVVRADGDLAIVVADKAGGGSAGRWRSG